MNTLFTKIYNKGMEFADSKAGHWFLFLLGAIDASIFPLPALTLFIGLCLVNSRKAPRYALFIASGIIAGSAFAYFLGHFAWIKPDNDFTALATFLMKHIPGFSPASYGKMHHLFTSWGYWILLVITASPLPYGIFSVCAGVFNTNFLLFLAITLTGTALKFTVIGYLSVKMKDQASKLLRHRLKPVAIILSAIIPIAVLVLYVLN